MILSGVGLGRFEHILAALWLAAERRAVRQTRSISLGSEKSGCGVGVRFSQSARCTALVMEWRSGSLLPAAPVVPQPPLLASGVALASGSRRQRSSRGGAAGGKRGFVVRALRRPLVVYHPALSLGGVLGHREASLVRVAFKGEEAGVAPVGRVRSRARRSNRAGSSSAPKQRLRALLPGLV